MQVSQLWAQTSNTKLQLMYSYKTMKAETTGIQTDIQLKTPQLHCKCKRLKLNVYATQKSNIRSD